jgi:hypothetical protein
VAVITVVPLRRAVASPLLLMEATVAVPELQVVIWLVISVMLVVKSGFLNVPVAVYWTVWATLTVWLAGVNAMESSCLTLKVTAGEVTPEAVAVMEVVPADFAVATPLAESMVATAVADEAQVTVKLDWVEPSLKVAVAMNCWVLPTLMVAGVAGVIAMDWSVACVTVKAAGEEVTPAAVAVMEVVPPVNPMARPLVELMEATAEADEFQTTLKFGVEVPSLKKPVAVNCWPGPSFNCGRCGTDGDVAQFWGTTAVARSQDQNTHKRNRRECQLAENFFS